MTGAEDTHKLLLHLQQTDLLGDKLTWEGCQSHQQLKAAEAAHLLRGCISRQPLLGVTQSRLEVDMSLPDR